MPIQIHVVIPNASPEPPATAEDVASVQTDPQAVIPGTTEVSRPHTAEATNRPHGNEGVDRPYSSNGRRSTKRPHRPTSAPISRRRAQVPARPHDITMHVASIYDIQNEHDYIMDKALKAYNKHRQSEEPNPRHTPGRENKLNGSGNLSRSGKDSENQSHKHVHVPTSQNGDAKLASDAVRWVRSSPTSPHPSPTSHTRHLNRHVITSSSLSSIDGASSTSSSSSNSAVPGKRRLRLSSTPTFPTTSKTSQNSTSRPRSASASSLTQLRQRQNFKTFQLSLCTLKDASGNEPAPVPHPHSSLGARGYLPLQRPWSAAPTARLDAIKEVSLANNVQDSTKSPRPNNYHKLHIRTVPSSGKMDPPPISRSAVYQVRNRTTHSWGEDANSQPDPMTMSCPNARSLEEYMRNARAYVPRDPNPSPVVVKGKALVSPTSPGQRPSSAYSYDGGFFLSAANANKDYFVIHPDWVSESMTVQKLPLNERQGRAHVRTLTVSGRRGVESIVGEDDVDDDKRLRRCKSAPPPKQRNPITWS